jgi:hypothetical protein
MINERDRQVSLCKRLQRRGFTSKHRVKLYGEEFDLISDPTVNGKGYGIDGMSRKSGSLRHLGIPLSVVRTVEHEFLLMESLDLTA